MLQGFPPLARADARILILGSMPGGASLQAGAYYAHPRNAFWSIMGAACGATPGLDYAERVCRLHEAGIAVWDVIGRCRRQGSLDAAIDADSVEVNDFSAFFQVHRSIGRILFNGTTARNLFMRHVRPVLADVPPLPMQCLPSTSPANAACRPVEKTAIWLTALGLSKTGLAEILSSDSV